MGRRIRPDKLPMTNMAISKEVSQLLKENKKKGHTMDEHLRRIINTHNSIVSSYNVIKKDWDWMEDMYLKASKMNETHWQTIENLKREIEIFTREKEGVAAAADCLKNLIDIEQEEEIQEQEQESESESEQPEQKQSEQQEQEVIQ